jgi:hypothetical protein
MDRAVPGDGVGRLKMAAYSVQRLMGDPPKPGGFRYRVTVYMTPDGLTEHCLVNGDPLVVRRDGTLENERLQMILMPVRDID